MAHLDYIIKGKPKFPVCLPCRGRGDKDRSFKLFREAGVKVFAYVDDDDLHNFDLKNPLVEYVIGPKRNFTNKMRDIVTHQQSLGNDFIWKFDDDYLSFQTKDMDAKTLKIDAGDFLASLEAHIDTRCDWFAKIPTGNIGLGMFGAGKKYHNPKFVSVSKGRLVLFSSGFGLNVKLMKDHNINFDPDVPHGCGEDLELICHFMKVNATGKVFRCVEGIRDLKVQSQCWQINVEAKKIAETSQYHKDVYRYLKKKYPDRIYWDKKGCLGTTINPSGNPSYPDWFINDYPDEYNALTTVKFGKI